MPMEVTWPPRWNLLALVHLRSVVTGACGSHMTVVVMATEDSPGVHLDEASVHKITSVSIGRRCRRRAREGHQVAVRTATAAMFVDQGALWYRCCQRSSVWNERTEGKSDDGRRASYNSCLPSSTSLCREVSGAAKYVACSTLWVRFPLICYLCENTTCIYIYMYVYIHIAVLHDTYLLEFTGSAFWDNSRNRYLNCHFRALYNCCHCCNIWNLWCLSMQKCSVFNRLYTVIASVVFLTALASNSSSSIQQLVTVLQDS